MRFKKNLILQSLVSKTHYHTVITVHHLQLAQSLIFLRNSYRDSKLILCVLFPLYLYFVLRIILFQVILMILSTFWNL